MSTEIHCTRLAATKVHDVIQHTRTVQFHFTIAYCTVYIIFFVKTGNSTLPALFIPGVHEYVET